MSYFSNFACKFDSCFIGFAAGIADENFGGGGHGAGGKGFFDEELGQRAGPRVMIEIGGVD